MNVGLRGRIYGSKFYMFQRRRRQHVDSMATRKEDVEKKLKAAIVVDNADVADSYTFNCVSINVGRRFWDPQRIAMAPSEENASVCICIRFINVSCPLGHGNNVVRFRAICMDNRSLILAAISITDSHRVDQL
jgi:hypothetical protein